jgi:hypothetical protein
VIVVDSSAVIAIFRQEDDAEDYARNIAADDDPVMSAANLVEISIVLRGLKKIAPETAERWLDDFMKAAGIRIEPVNTGSGAGGSLGTSEIRQSDRAWRGAELWRLLRLRAGKDNGRAATVQGERFSVD